MALLMLQAVDRTVAGSGFDPAALTTRASQPTLGLAPISLGNPAAAATLQILNPGRPAMAGATETGSHVRTVNVAAGDTLGSVLTNAGVAADDAQRAIVALRSEFDPRDLKIGQTVKLHFREDRPVSDPEFSGLTLSRDYSSRLVLERDTSGEFAARIEDIPLVREVAARAVTIRSSLYVDGRKAGLSSMLIAELIRIFSWDVDFQREIRDGDTFTVLYERLSDESGKVIREGSIQMATLTLRGEPIELVRHTDRDGMTDYYDAAGASVRKALLRTPIDGARLSSGYGLRRHPILGYDKMHRGIDFAAQTGTPIFAAGDGTVEFAGTNGGYGRYVRIRHVNGFATAYAHMSRIAVSKGARIQQGRIIGYVGTSGRSTGPHLHYEILRGGKQVNPATVKMPSGRKLSGDELKRFQQERTRVEARFRAVLERQELIASGS